MYEQNKNKNIKTEIEDKIGIRRTVQTEFEIQYTEFQRFIVLLDCRTLNNKVMTIRHIWAHLVRGKNKIGFEKLSS